MNFTDLSIAVIMGGQSAERAVSLRSGQAIVNALKAQKIQVTAIDGIDQLLHSSYHEFDAVFNILHGEAGENGQLASLLSSLKINYTGCDVTGAVLSWNKDIAKTLVAAKGIKTPHAQILTNAEKLVIKNDGPWIVKPTKEGSSVGLYYADNEQALKNAVQNALNDVDSILVEDFIEGTECTVSIIKGKSLPVVKIKPSEGLYDYQAKYESAETQYFCPSGFDEQTEKALQSDALIAYNALKLKGWGRVDFIVDKHGNRWFLEANTTPGMTQTSLVPKAAKAFGWDFKKLVLEILSTAFHNDEDKHDV